MTARPESTRGKSLQWVVLAASAALVLANTRRIGVPLLGSAALIAGALGLGLLLRRRLLGDLARLDSREALSEVISRSRGFRRLSLVWYEYVIARNIVRGTYAGEPPAQFKSDVYEASMNMSFGTRAAKRQTLWALGAMSIVMALIAALVNRGDMEMTLIMTGVFAVIVAFAASATFGVTWLASRTAHSRLGRRIEEASELPTDERWPTMLQIASEEITLNVPA